MAIRKSTTKMPQTVTVKQILKKCSSIRRKSSSDLLGVGDERLPEDFQRGHFAVYVGESRSRHIVPISWLGNPQFQCLLERAEEEYGLGHGIGITLPCEEAAFSSLVTSFVRDDRDIHSYNRIKTQYRGRHSGGSLFRIDLHFPTWKIYDDFKLCPSG